MTIPARTWDCSLSAWRRPRKLRSRPRTLDGKNADKPAPANQEYLPPLYQNPFRKRHDSICQVKGGVNKENGHTTKVPLRYLAFREKLARRLLAPPSPRVLLREASSLEPTATVDLNFGRRDLIRRIILFLTVFALAGSIVQAQTLKGCKLSANKFDPDSTSNQFGRCGSSFSPDSINNQFGKFGSPFSPYSVNNPYATHAPKIVSPDGTLLGRKSANQFDPDSTSNEFGVHGSQFSPTSINNPFGTYGSEFSPKSAKNPFATDTPSLEEDNAFGFQQKPNLP